VISAPAVNNIAFHVTVTAGSAYHLPGWEEADEINKEFRALADQWHMETGHLSSPEQIAGHRNYLRIIGKGEQVLPLILNDLRTRGGFWYTALEALTDASPVPPSAAGDMLAVRDAWINWGRQRGYVLA
jgi:hypothetical protein